MENANYGKLTSMHFYAWEKGLKTGMYYLRTKAATDAIKFTVNKEQLQKPAAEVTINTVEAEQKNQEAIACSLDNPDSCDVCGA